MFRGRHEAIQAILKTTLAKSFCIFAWCDFFCRPLFKTSLGHKVASIIHGKICCLNIALSIFTFLQLLRLPILVANPLSFSVMQL